MTIFSKKKEKTFNLGTYCWIECNKLSTFWHPWQRSYGKKRKLERKAFFVQGNTFRILCRGGDHNEVSMKRTAPDKREGISWGARRVWVIRERNRIFPKLFSGNLPGKCQLNLDFRTQEAAGITVKRKTAVAPDVSYLNWTPCTLFSFFFFLSFIVYLLDIFLLNIIYICANNTPIIYIDTIY